MLVRVACVATPVTSDTPMSWSRTKAFCPAYDCVTVNKATKLMRIRDSSCDGRKLSK